MPAAYFAAFPRTKHIRLSAAALAAALLLTAAPAHAQWLVQDNNLNEQIRISGNKVAPYTASGKVKDNSSTFNQLEFPLSPNDLLNPAKEAERAETYIQSAKEYIGEAGYGPNCNPEEKAKRPQLYANCLRARNIMGEQLKSLHATAQTLEARNRKLHALMQDNSYQTAGQLQQKQYEMQALQTLILNDIARIQTIQAAFNATRSMYQMRYEEEVQAKNTNKKALDAAGNDKPDLLSGTQKKVGRAVLLTALTAAANADNGRQLKDRSKIAGSGVEKVVDKGLGYLAK